MEFSNSPLTVCTVLSPNHSGLRTHAIDRIPGVSFTIAPQERVILAGHVHFDFVSNLTPSLTQIVPAADMKASHGK